MISKQGISKCRQEKKQTLVKYKFVLINVTKNKAKPKKRRIFLPLNAAPSKQPVSAFVVDMQWMHSPQHDLTVLPTGKLELRPTCQTCIPILLKLSICTYKTLT